MDALVSHWAGRIFGTNTGNVAVKFDESDGAELSGTLRLMDDAYGVAVYRISGEREQASVSFRGTPEASVEGVALGDITASATLESNGELRGEWTSSIGTGGTFILHPHGSPLYMQDGGRSAEERPVPEQVHTHSALIGSLSIFSEDIRSLVHEMEKDFTSPRSVVTFSSGKGETTKFFADFEIDLAAAHTLTYLQIQVQEAQPRSPGKVVVVEFRRHGLNEIRAQGPNESWVIGRVESLLIRLKQRRNLLVSGYKRVGGWFGQILFYSMIVFIVGLESWEQRAVIALLAFAILTAFNWVHTKIVPNAVMRLGLVRPGWIARTWPSVVSWGFTVVSAVLASYIFWIIQRSLEDVRAPAAPSSVQKSMAD